MFLQYFQFSVCTDKLQFVLPLQPQVILEYEYTFNMITLFIQINRINPNERLCPQFCNVIRTPAMKLCLCICTNQQKQTLISLFMTQCIYNHDYFKCQFIKKCHESMQTIAVLSLVSVLILRPQLNPFIILPKYICSVCYV